MIRSFMLVVFFFYLSLSATAGSVRKIECKNDERSAKLILTTSKRHEIIRVLFQFERASVEDSDEIEIKVTGKDNMKLKHEKEGYWVKIAQEKADTARTAKLLTFYVPKSPKPTPSKKDGKINFIHNYETTIYYADRKHQNEINMSCESRKVPAK